MRLLFAIILSCHLCSQAVAEHNQLTPAQVADGWISLFDGETLYGWQNVNDVDWQVADGEIRATKGGMGLLVSTSEFADYELHVEFHATEDTNSGVFLHTLKQPANASDDCYEVNIAPADNPFPTGSIVDRHLTDSSRVKPLGLWDGQWHTYDLTIQGDKLTIKLDGKLVTEYSDPNPRLRGHIGLQHNQGTIAFRNVRLKPLGTQSIFNGKDLTGWNIDSARASRFEVTPAGVLRVLDGSGQIESDGAYGDFVLQLECFVDGDALNSGIFFRCIPGEYMLGYECQIHNGMKKGSIKEGDLTKPSDCGTGGFYRRQDARRIVAKDFEWFAITLIADGPHMAAWVDGLQVSDWTDTRKPHENPRKGLRLEPGTFAIQGHDPTTDLRFRNLRVVEMQKEK